VTASSSGESGANLTFLAFDRGSHSNTFYTDVVGCRHLSTTPNGQMVFLAGQA
jgi:hypothetical protein